jgi:hypothetical protein
MIFLRRFFLLYKVLITYAFSISLLSLPEVIKKTRYAIASLRIDDVSNFSEEFIIMGISEDDTSEEPDTNEKYTANNFNPCDKFPGINIQ